MAKIWTSIVVGISGLSLLSGCAGIKRVTDSNITRDGVPCTRDSEEDDCTRYVQYEGLESGHKDHGFEEAHTKQGYENLREQRRERRESSRQQQFDAVPQVPTATDR